MNLRREIEWARYQERLRLLEQAERQRLRAPEPEPEDGTPMPQGWDTADWPHDTAVLLLPVLVLVIVGLTCGWAAFWIGLAVVCFVFGIGAARQRREL